MPLKFGREIATSVTVARVAMRVEDASGRSAVGWGETPLGVQWTWPGTLPHGLRDQALRDFAVAVARAWERFVERGDPIDLGHRFLEGELPGLLSGFNAGRQGEPPMPWLAALVCCSPFDIALHDAYGVLHAVPTCQTYNAQYMSRDLSAYLEPAPGGVIPRAVPPGLPRAPGDQPGGLAPGRRQGPAGRRASSTGSEPDDGYPVLLARLDPPRRPEVPQGQAARQRRGLGLRAAGRRWARSARSRASTG